MLYYIFRFLEQYDIPGAHMWSYISFRALLTLILALLISAWFGEKFIKWMKRRKIFETERDPEIDPFGVEKKGVPTMGGIIIIVSILIPVILLCRMRRLRQSHESTSEPLQEIGLSGTSWCKGAGKQGARRTGGRDKRGFCAGWRQASGRRSRPRLREREGPTSEAMWEG